MHRRFLPLAPLLLLLIAPAPGHPAPRDVAGAVRWVVSVEDPAGVPLAARLQGVGPAGEPLVPAGAPLHDSWTGHRHVHVEGPTEFLLDPGAVRLIVSRGPEFETHDLALTVTRDATERVVLRRLFDRGAGGWYSGDTHVHIAHGGEGDVFRVTPDDLALITRAEDLAVTCVLSNGLHFQGAGAHPAGSPEHLLHFAMEYRSALFGHMGLLGMPALLPEGCCLPEDPPYPTNASVSELAAGMGGTVVFAHPVPMDPALFADARREWPFSGFGRELPAVAARGRLHGFDILSYSNRSVEDAVDVWFDLLDLGFRVPATAGTDAGVNRSFDPPPGGFRMYARLPEGEPLAVDAWLASLRAGRTFVTNGPLIREFRLQGARIGGQLRIRREAWLVGSIFVETRDPVEVIEIVHNGRVIERLDAPPAASSFRLPLAVRVPPADGWIVARVRGTASEASTVGERLEALSSPIYLLGPEPGIPGREVAAARFTSWIRSLTELVLTRPDGGDPFRVAGVTSELEHARRIIEGSRDEGEPPREDVASLLGESDPAIGSPWSLERTAGGIRLRLPGRGSARLEVYSVDGRLRLSEDVTLPGDVTVDAPVPAGVYLVRVVPDAGPPRIRKIVLAP